MSDGLTVSKHGSPRRTRSNGFSLIELMVTVAIIAILTVTAVASYGFATVKTRRAAAKGCLTEAAQSMERYYTMRFTYVDAALPACSADVTQYYRVEFLGTPDASTFTVQAVPLNGQASSDTLCGTMSIDQVGHKAASGTGAAGACW